MIDLQASLQKSLTTEQGAKKDLSREVLGGSPTIKYEHLVIVLGRKHIGVLMQRGQILLFGHLS